jgi:glycogen debranching enzyme
MSLLKSKVDFLKEEYRLLGIVDIVLNHTANNSKWLLEHPSSAYNTHNCPHLNSAYVLDRALADFSDDFAQRRNVPECPSAPYINNEGDLRAVMQAIENRVFGRLKLFEYFMIDVERVLSEVKKYILENLQGKN